MTAQRNPFTYPGAITLNNLDALISFHRATFGGYCMEDDGGADGGDSGDGDKGGDEERTFTQEDVNRILADDRRKNEARYADWREKATKYDEALEAAKTEQEKAVEAAKNEGRTEALTAANARLVTAEARALAAEAKFRNPTLAVRAISLDGVKVNDDGSVDTDAIKAKLKELSDAEPYLVDDGKASKPKPDHSQGGGGGNVKASVARGREMFAEKHPQKTA